MEGFSTLYMNWTITNEIYYDKGFNSSKSRHHWVAVLTQSSNCINTLHRDINQQKVPTNKRYLHTARIHFHVDIVYIIYSTIGTVKQQSNWTDTYMERYYVEYNWATAQIQRGFNSITGSVSKQISLPLSTVAQK